MQPKKASAHRINVWSNFFREARDVIDRKGVLHPQTFKRLAREARSQDMPLYVSHHKNTAWFKKLAEDNGLVPVFRGPTLESFALAKDPSEFEMAAYTAKVEEPIKRLHEPVVAEDYVDLTMRVPRSTFESLIGSRLDSILATMEKQQRQITELIQENEDLHEHLTVVKKATQALRADHETLVELLGKEEMVSEEKERRVQVLDTIAPPTADNRLHVGIIGISPVALKDLTEEHPDFRFSIINDVRHIGMKYYHVFANRSALHNGDYQVLRNTFHDMSRLTQVEGGNTSIRRAVRGWCAVLRSQRG